MGRLEIRDKSTHNGKKCILYFVSCEMSLPLRPAMWDASLQEQRSEELLLALINQPASQSTTHNYEALRYFSTLEIFQRLERFYDTVMIVSNMTDELSSETVDWDNWTFDSFRYINDDTAFSAIQRKEFFQQYAWEIIDKVFDFSLAAPSESMETLLRTVSFVASNCSPRELYMMVVEKMSSCGCAIESTALTVLCFAMQIALLEISSQTFISDGLAVVMKCVTDAANFTAEADTDVVSKLSAIIATGLNFCEGFACSKQWGDNGAVVNDAVPSINDSFTAFKDHMVVWFLLTLCAECIVLEKNTLERSRGVERVVAIITNHTQLSLETILKHPYRARYFLFTSLSDLRQWRAAPTLTMTAMRSDDLLMKHLFHRVPHHEVTRGSTRGAGRRSDISGYRDKGCVCVEELVPWEMVTDQAVAALIASDTACLHRDEESDDQRPIARRRNELRVSRRMTHCGLDVDMDGRDRGRGSHGAWSLLGVAMVAEHALTSSRTFTRGQSELHMLPVVFSSAHLWTSFSPMLFPLLRSSRLAPFEGLRLASSLGAVMHALAEPKSSHSNDAQTPLLFLPVPACTAESDTLTGHSEETRSMDLGNSSSSSSSVSYTSIRCVLRALASHRGPCAETSQPVETVGSSSSLHDSHSNTHSYLLAGVGAAYSADALTLSQALISAMASSGDDKLRKSSLSSLRSFLRLFDPVSLLALLSRLQRDCPFPQLRGFLLDFIKSMSQSQSQSHLTHIPAEHEDDVEVKASPQLHTSHVKSDTTLGKHNREMHVPRVPTSECAADISDSELAPFQWRGPSSLIFFSALALKVFCLPVIGKVRSASSEQVLDAVDETGAAVNLLIHFVIKVNSIMEASVSSQAHTDQVAFFLGWDVLSLSDTNCSHAVTATRHLLHGEVKALVEEVLEIMRGKVKKLEGKILSSEVDYHPRIPWAQRVLLDQRGGREGVAEMCDAQQPVRGFDLLQLEVLLDNLEFLSRVLQ